MELDRQDYSEQIKEGNLCSPEDIKIGIYKPGCQVMTFQDYLNDKEEKEDEELQRENDSME